MSRVAAELLLTLAWWRSTPYMESFFAFSRNIRSAWAGLIDLPQYHSSLWLLWQCKTCDSNTDTVSDLYIHHLHWMYIFRTDSTVMLWGTPILNRRTNYQTTCTITLSVILFKMSSCSFHHYSNRVVLYSPVCWQHFLLYHKYCSHLQSSLFSVFVINNKLLSIELNTFVFHIKSLEWLLHYTELHYLNFKIVFENSGSKQSSWMASMTSVLIELVAVEMYWMSTSICMLTLVC